MTVDAEALLALMLTPGIGRTAVHVLLEVCSRLGIELPSLLQDPKTQRLPNNIQPELLNLLGRFRGSQVTYARNLLKRLLNCGARAITCYDKSYPESLRIALRRYAPPILYAFGDAALMGDPAAAVVGRTKPSRSGIDVVKQTCRCLMSVGATIVSGGAKGVDTAAHKTTLEEGGKTVVVLPQGILTYDIPAYLKKYLFVGTVLLVSEFLPDAPWETHSAVTRNATIAGLSRLICVVEPGRMHGSVRTARCGLEQGKIILVAPSEDTKDMSHLLFGLGAKSLLSGSHEVNVQGLRKAWETDLSEFRRGSEQTFFEDV